MQITRSSRRGSTSAPDGSVTLPFPETFRAKGLGTCTDRCGIPWRVNCAKPLEAVSGCGRGSAA